MDGPERAERGPTRDPAALNGVLLVRERRRPRLRAPHRAPAGGNADTAVVICPPLGFRGVLLPPASSACGGAGESGRPALRFDWPSDGDSSGSERDPALVAKWIAAVEAAAEKARERTGARRVALVGVTIGATLLLWQRPKVHGSQSSCPGHRPSRERRTCRRCGCFNDSPLDGTPRRRAHLQRCRPATRRRMILMSAETVRDLEVVDLADLRWEASQMSACSWPAPTPLRRTPSCSTP